MRNEIWTCRDGRKIPVNEMDVDHLRNVLSMMIRSKRRADRRKALAHEILQRAYEENEKFMSEFWEQESLEKFGDSR
jgi:hypothetical protein